jgi:hypothetical protein
MFARNAWIEGNINALSGNLGNLQVKGIITLGSEENEEDSIIQHYTGEWSIDGNGNACFKNIIASGKIETVIFEHEKI